MKVAKRIVLWCIALTAYCPLCCLPSKRSSHRFAGKGEHRRNRQTVATPVLSPSAGTYYSNQTVTITCSTVGATIYYTIDGTPPNPSSPVYTAPVSVAGNGTTKTIQAYATKSGMADSKVVSGTYVINYNQVATPQFTPTGGTFSSNQNITITCSTPGSAIHYTTDGTTPVHHPRCTALPFRLLATEPRKLSKRMQQRLGCLIHR